MDTTRRQQGSHGERGDRGREEEGFHNAQSSMPQFRLEKRSCASSLLAYLLGMGVISLLASVGLIASATRGWLLARRESNKYDVLPDVGYNDGLCVVCVSQPCGAVRFNGCDHAVVCLTCSSLVTMCPQCDQPIEGRPMPLNSLPFPLHGSCQWHGISAL